MGLTHNANRQTLYTEARLTWLLEAIDELHTAIADGELETVTTMSEADVVGMLHELIYTAREAIAEIEGQREAGLPRLVLVRKSS